MNGHFRRQCVYVLASVGLSMAVIAPARASITITGATVSATVQELIDGAPGSVNTDRQTWGVDVLDLPLNVSALLSSTDLAGVPVSEALGACTFADPTRIDQPNPEEFGLEVACYSNLESLAYLVRGSAIETRSVVFSPGEIDFALDGTQTVESRVFLTGAVIFWSTAPDADFGAMEATLGVTVTRVGRAAPLFATDLVVYGTDRMDVEVDASGPVRTEFLELSALAEEGADAESIAILEQVALQGSLRIVLIPSQTHAYTYTVSVGEDFQLQATFNVEVRNAPRGTGAAAVWGRPFRNLAEFIERGLPGLDGASVQRALNDAHAKRDLGIVSDDAPAAAPRGLCGVFGLATGAALSLGLCLLPRRSRQRRMPR